MKPLLTFILIILLCNSCSNGKTDLKTIKNTIPENKKIEVNSSFVYENNIFDLIEDIDVIQVKNSNNSELHFSPINQVVKFEDHYYLKTDNHAIYAINEKGILTNQLSHKGSNPNQYRELTSFDIHQKKRNLYVYDFQKQRFLIFDLDFNFIGIENIAYNFKSFKFHLGNLILFTAKHLNKIDNQVLNHDLIVLDSNYEIKIKAIKFDNNKFSKIRFYKPNPFYSYKDKLLFNDYISDTIFSLESNTFKKEFIFNYSNKSWSQEFKKQPHSEIMETLNSNPELFKDHDLLSNLSAINDNNLIYNYSNNGRNLFSFYSIKNKATKNYKFPDILGNTNGYNKILNSYLFDGKHFISIIYTKQLKFLKEEYEKKYGENDVSKNLDSIILNSNSAHNPIILKYSIKKINVIKP